LGLLNPNTTLKEIDEEGAVREYRPQLNHTQVYLYGERQANISKTIEWAGGDPIDLVHAGDITHGNAHPWALVSDRTGDQYIIARDNAASWLDYPQVKSLRVAIGTEAHNFGLGSAETVVVEMLRGQYPKRNIEAVYHGLLNVHGVTVDYAHHGTSPGIRRWTEGNVARLYLRDLMMRDADEGKPPPRLVIRGHYHQFHHTTIHERLRGKWWTSDLIILPSYCGMDDYGHKATRSRAYQHHGMVAVEIVDGDIARIRPMVTVLDLRTKETL
jgi:hypothetical protein